jgi:hypothetical protein
MMLLLRRRLELLLLLLLLRRRRWRRHWRRQQQRRRRLVEVTFRSNFSKMKWQKCDLSEKLRLKKTLLYLVLILKTPVSEKSKKNFKPKSGLFRKYFWSAT